MLWHVSAWAAADAASLHSPQRNGSCPACAARCASETYSSVVAWPPVLMTCGPGAGAGAGAGVIASSLPFSRGNEVSAAPDDDGGEYCGALMAARGG